MTIKRLFPLFIPALFLLVSCEEKEERSGPVTFTHSPVAYDRIYSSTPLGNLNPPGHVLPSNHMGFYLNGTTPAEIRAVADGRITTVYYNSSFDDYRIEFEHTRTFYSYLDHVSDIPAAIVEGADVKAGDLMGTGDGFDLGVVDYEITRNFIVPARYHDFSIHCGDPYLYFTPQIRDSLLMYNRRTVEPRGGKIDFDMQDGLAGNWFMVGTPLTYEASSYLYAANQIAFVYDMWEPENIRIVCGGTLELAPFDLRVDGNSPDPALVTSSSHLVKYELLRTPRATLLVRMYGPRKIRVEVFPNKTKSEVSDFTAAGKTYIR